jgi:hypothetical protein
VSGYCQAWSLRSQCLFGGKCEPCPYKWPHVPRCSKCGNYHRNPTEKCPQDYRRLPIESVPVVDEIIKCQICGLRHPLPGAGACNAHVVIFGKGFSAGRAYQAGKDEGAVRKQLGDAPAHVNSDVDHGLKLAIAALREAAKED